MSCLGASKAIFFQDGSSVAKYLEKSAQLEMVQEEHVQSAMESYLFGEGDSSLSIEAIPNAEERQESVDGFFVADKLMAFMLILLSALMLFPKPRESSLKFGLLFIAVWFLSQSIALMLTGGKKFSELAILAHAARWGLPLILLCLLVNKQNLSEWAGRIFISFTFAVHGWEALSLNPPFQDLLFNFAGHFGYRISSDSISGVLHTVGVMDIGLAVAVLIVKSPRVFLWMACWGFITAFSRPLTLGVDAWSEFAIRVANGGIPLWLLLNKPFKEKTRVEKQQKMEIACEI